MCAEVGKLRAEDEPSVRRVLVLLSLRNLQVIHAACTSDVDDSELQRSGSSHPLWVYKYLHRGSRSDNCFSASSIFSL